MRSLKVSTIFKMAAFGMLAAGACFFTASAATGLWSPQASSRVTMNFNRGWLYDSINNSATFASPTYVDSSWSHVCLPSANQNVAHAFFKPAPTSTSGAGASWTFPSTGGTSWYRKHYTPPVSYAGLRFLLQFEAVSSVCSLYVNGTYVGNHFGGYTPFTFDITSQLTVGQDNVIAVKVNSAIQSNVPPEGSTLDYFVWGGIERNVYLIVADPLYVSYNFVYMPNCSTHNCSPAGIATSRALIVNSAATPKNCTVITSIVDNSNNVVATGSATGTIAAGSSTVLSTTLSQIANLHLWSIDTPYLYSVYTQVMDSSAYVDQLNDTTGFRSIYFGIKTAATDSFWLNGKPVKLFGLDRHEEFPFVGRAAAARLQRKDADILKYQLGCNCVRCSHYPQAPDFIKECDRIGLMLIEEIPGWQYFPTTNATWIANLFQSLKEMITRDRNRPSVISWGVRVNESSDNNTIYLGTNDTARAMDPSRPTYGARMSSGAVSGYLEDIWCRTSPGATNSGPFPWFCVESVGANANPMGLVWSNDDTLLSVAAAHITAQAGGYNNAYQIGTLGWAAIDYQSSHPNAFSNANLGTRGQGSYMSPHGVISTFRIPKLDAYVFQSQRNPAIYGPMVFIANDWTSTSPTTVTVFSNCDSVNLSLNGVSEGTKKGTDGAGMPHPAFQWTVTPYTPGTLKAVGYYKGVIAATHQITTPSAPVKLVLTPDTSTIFDGGDMTRIVVSLVDSSGRAVHSRADSISMSATGAGLFIGELRSALEGGQFAFYVKSKDGVSGVVTCQASDITNPSIASADTTITVVLAPGSTPTGVRSVTGSSLAPQSRTMFRTFMSSKFLVPASAGKNALMSVYDLTGKLLYRKNVSPMQKIDLAKAFGASSATYIVKFESRQPAAQ